jgi:hypothetical protein
MRIKPKFYESLKERGATEFEMAALGFLSPAAQVMVRIVVDDGMPTSEALDALADREREL